MKKAIVIPQVGESITEATICTICKPSGSYVQADEELFEIETDKVNQVVYAPAAGQVTLDIAVDQTVQIGATVGEIDTSQAPPKEAPVAAKPQPEKEKEPEKKEALPQEASSTNTAKPVPQASGATLRIPRESFLKEAKASVATTTPATQSVASTERKKMSKIRQVIAQRLVKVKNETAMLTTFNEIDMAPVMALRAKHKEAFEKRHGARLGFMSFFVKASIRALQEIPGILAYLEGGDIVYRNTYDIGVAVGTDKGLMVPVLKGADKMSFAQVESSIANYAKQAREGSISLDALQGGGFTITNGGVYGSLLSTPILNPPQSGILGLHRIEKRAVVVNDEIVIRPMMYVALSYDHRIVDGKEAVTFLVRIKESLEQPERLLLEL